MIADHGGEELPLFVVPPWRNGKTQKKLARGLLRRFVRVHFANSMQSRGGNQQAPKAGIAESGSGVPPFQDVKHRNSDPGDLRSAARARIHGARGGLQTGLSGGFDASVGGEPGAPDVPETGFSQRKLTIRGHAFMALARDHFVPKLEREKPVSGTSGAPGSPPTDAS